MSFFQQRHRTILMLTTAALAALPVCASHLHRGPTAPSHKSKSFKAAKQHAAASASSRPRAIDDSRATEIQTALVKAGYLQSASGHWDDSSADAMRKMQGDNGWQTKLTPDPRALIKLGLGGDSSAAAAGAPAATALNGVGQQ